MPQSARLSAGVVQWLFGQCPNELLYFFVGASLTSKCKKSGCSEAEEDDLGHFEELMLLLLLVRSFSDLPSPPSVQALYRDGQVC